VNFLGGFIGAILLAQFSLMMGYESMHRLISPVEIQYDQAIYVAIWGLFINLASMWLLKDDEHHHHHHGDDHGHDHHDHEDQNLRSAYLHVLADALTSGLAIVALLCGKFYQVTWMDPMMGIVGAILVIRWSISLLKITGKQLLDHQSHQNFISELLDEVRASCDDIKITDLHVWLIGPGIFNLNMSLMVRDQKMTVENIKTMLNDYPEIVHSTIEIRYE
jgi:cation diffusion facilitator family transporter